MEKLSQKYLEKYTSSSAVAIEHIPDLIEIVRIETLIDSLPHYENRQLLRDQRLDSILIRNSKFNFYEENGAEVYELEVNLPKKYFNGDGTWSDGF